MHFCGFTLEASGFTGFVWGLASSLCFCDALCTIVMQQVLLEKPNINGRHLQARGREVLHNSLITLVNIQTHTNPNDNKTLCYTVHGAKTEMMDTSWKKNGPLLKSGLVSYIQVITVRIYYTKNSC